MKLKNYSLIFFCIFICNGCKNATEKIDIIEISKSENVRVQDIESNFLIHRLDYQGYEFANRFKFYSNGNLKEYSFQNDDVNSGFIVKFDSLRNTILKIEGDPLVHTYFDLNDKRDSFRIKGIISLLISDSIVLSVKDKITKTDYFLMLGDQNIGSDLIKLFNIDIASPYDSIDVDISIKSKSARFGDSTYVNNFSFKKK